MPKGWGNLSKSAKADRKLRYHLVWVKPPTGGTSDTGAPAAESRPQTPTISETELQKVLGVQQWAGGNRAPLGANLAPPGVNRGQIFLRPLRAE